MGGSEDGVDAQVPTVSRYLRPLRRPRCSLSASLKAPEICFAAFSGCPPPYRKRAWTKLPTWLTLATTKHVLRLLSHGSVITDITHRFPVRVPNFWAAPAWFRHRGHPSDIIPLSLLSRVQTQPGLWCPGFCTMSPCPSFRGLANSCLAITRC